MGDGEENGEEKDKRESEREKEWSGVGVGGVQHLRRMGEGAGWQACNEAEARKGAREIQDHSSPS